MAEVLKANIDVAVNKAFEYGGLMTSAGHGLETIFDLLGLDGSSYDLSERAESGLASAALAIAGLLREAGCSLCGSAEMAGALDKEG